MFNIDNIIKILKRLFSILLSFMKCRNQHNGLTKEVILIVDVQDRITVRI